MTTDDHDSFEGRRHGNIVFRTTQIRAYYIGLWASQQKEWLRDHPNHYQTVADALRDLQLVPGLTSKLNQPSRARRSRQ